MDRRGIISVYLLAAASLTLAMVAAADSVTLKTGKTIEGQITEETAEAVKIDAGGMLLTLNKSRIESISRSAVSENAPPTNVPSAQDLEATESRGDWPGLYEAAVERLKANPKDKTAAEKRDRAATEIRKTFDEERVAKLVLERKFDEALKVLDEAIRKSGLSSRPAGAVGNRARAELYLKRAEYQMHITKAMKTPLKYIQEARELDPETPRLDYLEGRVFYTMRNFDRATLLLERAAKATPDDHYVLQLLMICYHENGQYAKVAKVYDSAPELVDTIAARTPEVRTLLTGTYSRLAMQRAEDGATSAACAAYETYLRFTERTFDQLREAETFYTKMGDAKRAEATRDERFGRLQPAGAETPAATTPDVKPAWLRDDSNMEKR